MLSFFWKNEEFDISPNGFQVLRDITRRAFTAYTHLRYQDMIDQQEAQALSTIPGVTLHELWQAYPDYQIDIELEQQRLREHDTILMLFPFW